MAISLRFFVQKNFRPHVPNPREVGASYRVVHDENLLPTVALAAGEEVLASARCTRYTLVLTNARILRGGHSGLEEGWWWELTDFAHPTKKVEEAGDAFTARIIPNASLTFSTGLTMRFDEVDPAEAGFLYSVARIAEWVLAQTRYPGRVPEDVRILRRPT